MGIGEGVGSTSFFVEGRMGGGFRSRFSFLVEEDDELDDDRRDFERLEELL